ncbi:MAG TPA: DEAD/DEAH box helicase family protein [Solirubrobacteraceae bacterium]|nr:DEAD/DEAH box helicase family protein [Solirubrobacteraceae bacterium]
MNAKARVTGEVFSPDQLVLAVSESYDRDKFPLDLYDQFLDEISNNRDYQGRASRSVLRLFCGGQYKDTAELSRKSFAALPDLKRRYGSEEALIERLAFPDILSCSLDLATGTGKSYVMYAVARVMLNEGIVDRVLVLCPSLTIESGLKSKFNELTSNADLTNVLPVRSGIPIPTIVDAGSTIKPGEICVENIHATYERSGSSLDDSFTGLGERTLVISDEAHHVIAGGVADRRRWHDFIAAERFGFRYHLGVSGTCYVGNEYFADVVDRYAIRDAINERWVKEVYYLEEDESTTEEERFLKLLNNHEKNRKTHKPNKPLTIAVTANINAAEKLAEQLREFLATQKGYTKKLAEQRVLLVTSSAKHKAAVKKLATVDDADDSTEWIVSVSMLSEGWDVKNVFQIYPHEKRAFNSKLLISQVLGRGLRIPKGVSGQPIVWVFNHQRWGPEIDKFVAEILDVETTMGQRPVQRDGAPHFDLHLPEYAAVTTGETGKKLEVNKKLTKLNLHPQLDATEETKFVSATDETRSEVLTTKVIHRLYPVDDVIEEVRRKLLDADARTGGTLAKEYTRKKVSDLVVRALKSRGGDGRQVNQENRQIILNSFGGLRQRTAVPKAKIVAKPTGLKTISTQDMRVVYERISGLTNATGLFYDEESRGLSEDDDVVALDKALDIDAPTNIDEIPNSFDFKSPTNVVLTSHRPELRFVRKLMQAKNAAVLKSWVKAPDTSFYEIEYTWQEGGIGRSKRGRFNPDFFLLAKDADLAVVVETKMDADDSWQNVGKAQSSIAHFKVVNDLLKKQASERRYSFHFLSPVDYDRFFEALRDGTVGDFKSTLQANLETKRPEA